MKEKHIHINAESSQKFLHYFLLGLTVLLSVFIRCRYLTLPLERDEGEYAYAGLQIRNGYAAYENVYNMKFPGAYFFYALIFLFSHSLVFIRLCFLIVHLSQVYILFFITRNLMKDYKPAVYTCIIYILLTSSFSSFGLLGKAEPFAVLFFLAGLYLLIRQTVNSKEKKSMFVFAGLLFGCCFLIKQNCLLFSLMAAAYILFYAENKLRSLLYFITGFIIPIMLLIAHLWIEGTFTNFRFFTIDYARQYGGIVSFKTGWGIFRFELDKLLMYNNYIFIIGACGVIYMFFASIKSGKFRFIIIWAICSLIAFSAGYYFRPHYFLLVYPSFAIAGGVLLYEISAFKFLKIAPLITICFFIFSFIRLQTDYIFKDNSVTTMHKMYIWTPFPECIPIAEHIKEITNENAKIGMIGNEPEIAFYADRELASGYLYLYPFFENQEYALQMTHQFIDEMEKNAPEIMIFSNVSWDATKNKKCEKIIEDWWESYKIHYSLEESVCSDSDEGVKFFTTQEPKAFFTHWVACIKVYKKINAVQ